MKATAAATESDCSDPAVKETQGVNLLSRNGNSQTGERMTQKRPRDGWILDPHGPERNGSRSVAPYHYVNGK